MAERAIPRVTRLLGIVTHLEEYGQASFEELAEHFGVTAEQIRQDIETLWVSGLPGYGINDLLDFDGWAFDEGIARITASQGVRQVRLSASEAVALLGAVASMVAAGVAPASADRVLGELSKAVGAATPVQVLGNSTVDPALAALLRDATANRRHVTLTYIDAQDRKTERVVEPHRLVAVDGVGYLECFCLRADDYRTLRLDRIEAATPADGAAVHPVREALGFTLAPMYDATVTVDPQARWIFEDLPDVVFAAHDQVVEARFGVANPAVVVARLLAVAPALKSVEPAALRASLEFAARAVVEAHESSSASH